MAESLRCPRFRAGQRWLQAAVEVVLAHASIPLASSVAHQPAIAWGPQTGTRQSLYLWLAEEAAPRHLSFPRALIEDCGAGSRPHQSYARAYMLRSLRQMGVLSS